MYFKLLSYYPTVCWYFFTLIVWVNKRQTLNKRRITWESSGGFPSLISVDLNYPTWQLLACRVSCWQTWAWERTELSPVSPSNTQTGGHQVGKLCRFRENTHYKLQTTNFKYLHFAIALLLPAQRGQFQTEIIVGSLLWDAGKLESNVGE